MATLQKKIVIVLTQSGNQNCTLKEIKDMASLRLEYLHLRSGSIREQFLCRKCGDSYCDRSLWRLLWLVNVISVRSGIASPAVVESVRLNLLQNLSLKVEEYETNLMSQFIKFYFTSSTLNMFRSLIHPSSGACDFSIVQYHHIGCVFFFRCVLEFRCGWVGVVSVLQAEPHQNSNTHRNKNTRPMRWYNRKIAGSWWWMY